MRKFLYSIDSLQYALHSRLREVNIGIPSFLLFRTRVKLQKQLLIVDEI